MKDNLFNNIPTDLPDELFQTLAQSDGVRVERIVSRGHTTPKGQWYDQKQNEWVVLLSGAARIVIAGQDEEVILGPGDHVLLPAGLHHRVEWTAPEQDSVWLAIHFR